MKDFIVASITFFGLIGLYNTTEAASRPSENLLQSLRNRDDFGLYAKAYGDAVYFSGFKGPTKSKLPGPWRLRTELGAGVFDTNDQILVDISTAGDDELRRSPDGYQSLFLKGGFSFPYGLQLDLNLSYVSTQIKAYAAAGHLTFQAFDFAEYVLTDMVPSIAISTSFHYNFKGGKVYGLTPQLLIGSYHRYWMAQVNYILQVSKIYVSGVSPSYSYTRLRHGIASTWPLYEGLTLTTHLIYPRLEASASLAYQF